MNRPSSTVKFTFEIKQNQVIEIKGRKKKNKSSKMNERRVKVQKVM